MKKILVITMVLLALSFVLFAQNMQQKQMKDDCTNCADCKDQPMMQGKGMGNHQMMNWDKNMMQELNLSKDQIKKIETLRADHMKMMNTNKARLENLQIDKKNAMKAEDFNKVKQLNKNISDLELENANKMVDHHQTMMKELTPEQKAKLEELRPMGKQGMMQNHDGMGMKQQNKGK